MIDALTLKNLVSAAAQQAIHDYDSDISNRVKKLLYKAEGLKKEVEYHDREASRHREKLRVVIERINRLREGDWTELLTEDESKPSYQSGSGEVIQGKDETVPATNP